MAWARLIRAGIGFALACTLAAEGSGCARQASRGPVVASARWAGEFTPGDGSRAGVLFQDGAQSIAVPGGSLWAFGDTFLGHRIGPTTRPDYIGAVGATIAFLPEGAKTQSPELRYLTDATGVAANPLLPLPGEDPKKLRMWPTGGVQVGERTYLFYSLIEATDGPGPWNFRGLGGGLAVAEKPLSVYRRLTPDGSSRYLLEPICVLRHEDWLYCYQVCNEAKRKGLIIARVRGEEIENPGAYRFFDGRDWVASPDAAAVVLREAYGQVSVCWNPKLKAFLMATSSDFFHPEEIQLRTGTTPVGPWSAPTRIAVPPKVGKKTNFIYCAFIHPELSSEDGQVVALTFCRQLAGDWEFSSPEIVRVRLGDRCAGE